MIKSREWIKNGKQSIKDRLANIDASDFYVNHFQNNGYYPIERFLLVDDKYHRFYYKQGSWRFSGVIDADKIIDFLFSDYYAITTLPTNDFMEVSYGRRDYYDNDFNADIPNPLMFRVVLEGEYTKEEYIDYYSKNNE